MSVIQLEIEDTLIHEVGIKAVQEFMERQLSLLRLQYLGDKIATAIRKAGIDHAREVKEARQEAWQEYKNTHLKELR